ncbi:hypothetical protein ENSA5_64870 [Enhygromyxa salina]|uniref:Uncharacterized protein n=1 Tax=Enhygromyxa salina TaxID=215803 RepID=A0A2S9XC82_9BACT|nr:hypothetical protein [Enhygromyxa salina]PRP90473.1 hypothetical protein ENSA5_64870 [Enhygromyxa salina]
MDTLAHPSSRTPHSPARPRLVVRPLPTFFVRVPAGRELPAGAELELYLRRWIMKELGGWLQIAVVELLAEGSVEWTLDAALDGQGSDRVLAVRCLDRRGPRRPGLWAALAVAHALAQLSDGVVVDPRRSASAFGRCAWSRAPADGRVHVANHLCVPSSRGPDARRWLSSVGMAHFGLPDLELLAVPDSLAELGARLLLGVAQHVIDASWSPPRANEHPREVLLTVGELHWALGGEPGSVPITTGRGWTRAAVELDASRGWPERMRIGPPLGARSWRDEGAWIRDAWADLFGVAKNLDRLH